MSKRFRIRTIYAKIETVKGTDSVPTGANAILTKNFQWDDPYAGDRISRDLDVAGLGIQEEINISPHTTFSFDVELAGSGAAGTAPAFKDLLRAAGWAETLSVGVDAQYDLVSDFADSVSIYVVIDGDLQKVLGCVGTWSMTYPKGIPTMSFKMLGNYAKPINDAAPLTPDYTAFQKPVPMTKANTTFSFDGYAAPLISMTIDSGIQTVVRNIPNLQEIIQTDRGITGTIVIQAPKVSQKDVFADLVESHTAINTGVLQIVHGTVAGNIVQLDAPIMQVSSVNEGNESGEQTYSMNARFIPSSAGDDELKITFK